MAIRNISVVISANVRKYTDGLRTAATATKNFQRQVNGSGQVVASNARTVKAAAREHTQYEKALHGVSRGAGVGMAGINRLSAATRNGNRALAAATQETTGWARALTFVKTASIQAVAAMGGFMFINAAITGVIKGFTFMKDSVLEFDRAMTESMAIMEVQSQTVREQFEKTAMAISKTRAFAPEEVAEGYYHLIAAGMDAEQTINSIGVVSDFAQAGMMDMEKATEMLVQSQSALGMTSTNAEVNLANLSRIADVFTVAAVESTASIEDMGDAFTNKFGTALALANKGVEEGAAILMAYARVGIKGRIAGTQASIFLRDIQNAAIKNEQAMRDLGIQVYDTGGNMLSLVEIAKSMNQNLGSMSSKELRMTLKELGFADRAVHAILPLVATGADQWDEYWGAVNSAEGRTLQIAEAQMTSMVNQLKVLTNRAKEFAVVLGGGLISGIKKVWEQVEDPIKNIVKNLQEIGQGTLLPALKDVGKFIAGPAVIGALKAVLETVELITAGFQFMGPVLKPVITALLAFKTFQMIGTVAAGVFGMLNRGWTGVTANIQRANKARADFNNQGRVFSVGSSGVAAQQNLTAMQQLKAAASGTFSSIKAGWTAASTTSGSFFARAQAGMAAMKASASAMGATLMNAFAGAAIVATSLFALYQTIQSMDNAAQDRGKARVEALKQGDNVTSVEGLRKYREELEASYDDIDAIENATNDQMKGLGRLAVAFGMTANEANNWRDETDKAVQGTKDQEAILTSAARTVARETGFTIDAVQAKINSMGIGEELLKGLDTDEGKAALDRLRQGMGDVAGAAGPMGLSLEQAAQMSAEEFEELAGSMDEVSEAMAEVFAGIVNPVDILSGINTIKEEMFTAFGTDLPGVFSDLTSEMKEAADKATENAFESYSDGLDSQIKALEDRKEELKVPKGTKEDSPLRDQIDAEKDAIDDQIESLRDGKREREEFAAAPGQISLSQFLGRLSSESIQMQEFNTSLETMRQRLREMGIPASQVDSMVGALASLGAEGKPLIDEFAAAGEERFRQMAESMLASMQVLEPETSATLAEFRDAQLAAGKEVANLGADMIKIVEALTAQGVVIEPADMAAFVGLGPEMAALVPQMLAEAQGGGQGGAQAVADLIKITLTNADFGEGNIPQAVMDGMIMAQALASGDENKIAEAVMQGTDVQAMRDFFTLNGMADAAAYMDGFEVALYNSEPAKRKRQEARQLLNTGAIGDNSGGGGGGGGDKGGEPYRHPFGQANGGIIDFFANGGFKEKHNAQIAKAGDWRVWAEPETGGEAYIPLGKQKRAQALPVLAEVARRFGYQMNQYANGGITSAPGAPMVGGGQWGTPAAVQIIPVPVPVQSKNEYNFGNIEGVRMEDAEKYANRKRRQQRLAGGRR